MGYGDYEYGDLVTVSGWLLASSPSRSDFKWLDA